MPHNPSRLKVLERAFALAVDVHKLADRHQAEIARVSPGMRSQLLRAVDSIALNITEAAGHTSPTRTSAQLMVAIASANEVELQLRLGRALDVIAADYDTLIDEVIAIRKMCFGLRRHLQQNRAGESSRQNRDGDRSIEK